MNLANATTSEEDHKKRPIETTDCFVQDCFINRPDFKILQLGIFTCKAKEKKVSLSICRSETTLVTWKSNTFLQFVILTENTHFTGFKIAAVSHTVTNFYINTSSPKVDILSTRPNRINIYTMNHWYLYLIFKDMPRHCVYCNFAALLFLAHFRYCLQTKTKAKNLTWVQLL